MTLTFTSYAADWWPYLFIALAGWLPNDIWRFLGVVFAGRLSETSEGFVAVKAVATALVASVVAQLVLYPSGHLATAPLWLRGATMAVGLLAYQRCGQHLGIGILAGEAVFLGGWWALGLA